MTKAALRSIWLLLLCLFFNLPRVWAQCAPPDAALQDTVDNFTNCTYSFLSAGFNLTVENISTTASTNTGYTIEWGDGTSNSYGPGFTTASHLYTQPGSFNLKLTVTGAGGCSSTKSYLVFNGSNPSFGVASQGNTNDCAPATFTFDIINTAGNTPSTVYTFQFDDGTPAVTYTHANLPKTITHTFTKSAMGMPGNAFTLTAYATNPCGTTPATVGGIRISTTPKADFLINPDSTGCTNALVKLTDISDGGFNANSPTSGNIREWKILPATGWFFTNGTNAASASPVVQFTQAGNYTIKLIVTPRGASSKCSPDSISRNYTVILPPKPSFSFTKSSNGCVPVTLKTTNTSTGHNLKYVWSVSPKTGWSFTAGTDSASVNPQFLFTKAGSYTLTLAGSNACAQGVKKDTVIVIKDVPVAKLPKAQQYCGPQTIAFAPANAAHAPVFEASSGNISAYNWTVTGANGAVFVNGTAATSRHPEIRFTRPGVYTVSVTATNECGTSQAASQQVIINDYPVVKVNYAASVLCAGSTSATLTATGAHTYTWSPATGLNATSGASITASPMVTTTYTVTGTDTLTGCSDTAQVTVRVYPITDVKVQAKNGTQFCFGQAKTVLKATGADSYTWFPATGLSATTGDSVLATPSVTTTYIVTGTNALNGCTDTARVTVVVNPLPVVKAGRDTTVCFTTIPVQLQGQPAGGVWTGTGISSTGRFTATALGTFRMKYTYTDTKGCTAADSVLVTVVPPPVVNAGADTSVCMGSAPVQLKGMPAGGTWTSVSQITGGTNVSSSGLFNPQAAGTYTLTYTYGTGNCQVSDNVVITVRPLPAAPAATGASVCPGAVATLQATAPSGSIQWFDAATGGSLLHTGASFTTPALTATKTYYAQVTDPTGCSSSSRTAVTATVLPLPAAPVVADVTVCGTGSAATFTTNAAANTSYEWYDRPNGGTLLHTGNTFTTPALAATTVYYVQAVSTSGCVSASRTTVKAQVLPALTNNTVSAAQLICSGSVPAPLAGAAPAGGTGTFTYSWQSSTNGTTFTTAAGASAGANYAPAALTQSTWFRRIVKSGVCTDTSAAVKITVEPLPAAPVAANATICAGSTATLTATVAANVTVKWYDVATNGTALSTGSSFTTPALAISRTYYVEAVSSNGCISSGRTAVTVTVLPAIANNNITASQTICAGTAPAMLNGSAPTGGNSTYIYSWESSTDNITFSPASGAASGAGYAPGALTQTTWFRRVVNSGPCQQHISAAIKVTVLPPVANNTISGDQTICAGTPAAALTGSQPTGGDGTYTYLWEVSTSGNPNTFAPASGANAGITYTPGALTQTRWFRRTVTSGQCTLVSAAVKVTVNPQIGDNIISASQTIYAGTAPAPFTGTAPTGGDGTYSFTWESSTTGPNSGFAPAAGTHTAANYSAGVLTQTTWYRRVVTSGGCTHVSAPVQVTITPAVADNFIQQDQTICIGTVPSSLTGSSPRGGNGSFSFLWVSSTSGPRSGFTTAAGTSNGQHYAPAALSQTTWYRRIVISGAYADTSTVVQISVTPQLSNNTISGEQTVCSGSPATLLNGSLPNGGTGSFSFLWESSTTGPNSGFNTAAGQSTGQNYLPGALTQTTWFRRRVSSGSCNEAMSNAVQVTVNPVPNVPQVEPVTVCPGEQAVLQATGLVYTATTRVEWYDVKNGGTPVFTGSTFTTPQLSKTMTYYVQAVDESCASRRTSVTVTVPTNTADAGTDAHILIGRSTRLQGKGGVKYSWLPATGLSNPNIANPIASPKETTTYQLTVETEQGCTFTDEVTVHVASPLVIPNTFSPNGDGINDTWEIENIRDFPNCRIEIFNRWGSKVYHSEGYSREWDGRTMNGEILPVATYYYIIHLPLLEEPLSGSITIIR